MSRVNVAAFSVCELSKPLEEEPVRFVNASNIPFFTCKAGKSMDKVILEPRSMRRREVKFNLRSGSVLSTQDTRLGGSLGWSWTGIGIFCFNYEEGCNFFILKAILCKLCFTELGFWVAIQCKQVWREGFRLPSVSFRVKTPSKEFGNVKENRKYSQKEKFLKTEMEKMISWRGNLSSPISCRFILLFHLQCRVLLDIWRLCRPQPNPISTFLCCKK